MQNILGGLAILLSIILVTSAAVAQVWRVRSPTTMLGLELDISGVSYARLTYPMRTGNDDTGNHGTILLSPAVVIKRFRPLRSGVAPFSYQTIYTDIRYARTHIGSSEDRLDWSVGVGLGFGVAWFPWRRVSFSLRQGIELSYKYASNVPPKPELDHSHRFSLGVPSMRLLALVHF